MTIPTEDEAAIEQGVAYTLTKPQGFVGFWHRVMAQIVEMIIFAIPCVYIFRYIKKEAFQHGTVLPLILYYLVFCGCATFSIVKWGGFVGKLVLGYRIVNVQGKYLSWRQAVIRNFYSYISCSVYILTIYEQIAPRKSSSIAHIHDAWTAVFWILTITNIILMARKRQKRMLHDIAANSYVVYKGTVPENYMNL